MENKKLFEAAMSAKMSDYPFSDTETIMNNIMERADKMKKYEKVRQIRFTEITPEHIEPKKSHKAFSVFAGIAGTAAVLTGAVFGLKFIAENGGLKGPDVQSAGYRDDSGQEEMSDAVTAAEDNEASIAATLEYDDCTIVITDYKFDGLRLDLTYDYYPKYLDPGRYSILLGCTATNIGGSSGTIDMEAFEKQEPTPYYGRKTSYMLFSPANGIDVGFLTGLEDKMSPTDIQMQIDNTEVGSINSELRRETVNGIVHCTLPVNSERAVTLIDAPAWVEQPNGKSLKLDRMYIAGSAVMCVYPNVSEDIFDDWDDDIADMEVFLIGETDGIKMSEDSLPVHDEYAEEKTDYALSHHYKFGDTIYMWYFSDREFGADNVRAVFLNGRQIICRNGDTDAFYQPTLFESFYIPPEEDRKLLTDAHVETEKCDIDVNWLSFDGMTLILQYDVTFRDGVPDDELLIPPIWAFGDNYDRLYTTHGSRVDKLGVNGDTVSYIGEIVYNRVMSGEPLKIYFMDDHTWSSEVLIPFDEKSTAVMMILTPGELPGVETGTYKTGKEVECRTGKAITVESVTLGRYSAMFTIDCDSSVGFDLHDTYLVMNDGRVIDLDALENKGGTGIENKQIIYHFILSESIDPGAVKEIYVCGVQIYGGEEAVPTMQSEELPEETNDGDTTNTVGDLSLIEGIYAPGEEPYEVIENGEASESTSSVTLPEFPIAIGNGNGFYGEYLETPITGDDAWELVKERGGIDFGYDLPYDRNLFTFTGAAFVIDYADCDVTAIVGGTVEFAGWYNGWGQTVLLRDENGHYWLYGHLGEISAAEGDTVEAGAKVGHTGTSGLTTHQLFAMRVG